MKLLIHSNAPWAPSGYGQQVSLFAGPLSRKHDLAISAFVGLFGSRLSFGDIDVYPGGGRWGNDTVEGHAFNHFGSSRGGLVISLVDVPVLDPEIWRNLNVASWLPVDHDPAPPEVLGFLAASDAIPIAMARHGQEQLREFDPLYVPHGIDTSTFRPIDRAEARAACDFPADAFLVGVVAMNKGNPSRKSLPLIVDAFAAIAERHEEAILYMHTDRTGGNDGVDLDAVMANAGVDPNRVIFADHYRLHLLPYSQDEMAYLYSSMDVLLNPSMGEGFGLTVLEAQACGVPAVVTDFTAMSEVCGAGWKVGFDREWTNFFSWQAQPHLEEVIEAVEECYAMDSAARIELSDQARKHALTYDVDRVFDQYWVPALDEIERRLADRLPAPVMA